MYDASDVCAVLPAWVAQVEKEEDTKGVASAQLWTGIRAVLDAECIVGCNQLVGPSSFPVTSCSWGILEPSWRGGATHRPHPRLVSSTAY